MFREHRASKGYLVIRDLKETTVWMVLGETQVYQVNPANVDLVVFLVRLANLDREGRGACPVNGDFPDLRAVLDLSDLRENVVLRERLD